MPEELEGSATASYRSAAALGDQAPRQTCHGGPEAHFSSHFSCPCRWSCFFHAGRLPPIRDGKVDNSRYAGAVWCEAKRTSEASGGKRPADLALWMRARSRERRLLRRRCQEGDDRAIATASTWGPWQYPALWLGFDPRPYMYIYIYI